MGHLGVFLLSYCERSANAASMRASRDRIRLVLVAFLCLALRAGPWHRARSDTDKKPNCKLVFIGIMEKKMETTIASWGYERNRVQLCFNQPLLLQWEDLTVIELPHLRHDHEALQALSQKAHRQPGFRVWGVGFRVALACVC